MPGLRTKVALPALACFLAVTPAKSQLLTSFVDASSTHGQHIVYLDTSSHIYHLYWNGSSWSNQNLTSTYGGSPYAYTSLTSWVDTSGDYHIAYLGISGSSYHINQIFWTGSTWSNQDLTALAGGGSPDVYSPLTSWVDHSGGQHIGYTDTSQHINQLLYTGSWGNQDLTAMTSGPLYAYYGFITSWVDNSGGQHIGYQDTSGHINQLLYTGGSSWSNQNLTSYGGTPYTPAQGLTSWVDTSSQHGQHIAYFDSNKYVDQLLYTGGSSWSNQNVSSLAGGGTADPYSITSWVDTSGAQHIGYLDPSFDINQLIYSGSSWGHQNITSLAGGGSPYQYSPLTSWVDHSGAQHIGYIDTNQHVNQVFWNGSTWTNQDLTAVVSGPKAQV